MQFVTSSDIRISNTLPDRVQNLKTADFKKLINDGLISRSLYSFRELQEEPILAKFTFHHLVNSGF